MLVPLQHFFNTDVFAYIHVGTAYTYWPQTLIAIWQQQLVWQTSQKLKIIMDWIQKFDLELRLGQEAAFAIFVGLHG